MPGQYSWMPREPTLPCPVHYDTALLVMRNVNLDKNKIKQRIRISKHFPQEQICLQQAGEVPPRSLMGIILLFLDLCWD